MEKPIAIRLARAGCFAAGRATLGVAAAKSLAWKPGVQRRGAAGKRLRQAPAAIVSRRRVEKPAAQLVPVSASLFAAGTFRRKNGGREWDCRHGRIVRRRGLPTWNFVGHAGSCANQKKSDDEHPCRDHIHPLSRADFSGRPFRIRPPVLVPASTRGSIRSFGKGGRP
jgi:hypothetical protein